jgi:SAM-dependent methyltransferase
LIDQGQVFYLPWCYNRGMGRYDDKIAQAYLNFLDSENGRIQQRVLTNAISLRLPRNNTARLLDAGCGSGWLTYALSKTYENIEGCDGAPVFINFAKKFYPKIKFSLVDLEQPLLYQDNYFDSVILNMVAHDTLNQKQAFANLVATIKPGGQFIITIPNPYYAFPVGSWHRSLFDVVTRKRPWLELVSYNKSHQLKYNGWSKSKNISTSSMYTLPEQIDNALASGLNLIKIEELVSETDDGKFNLNYQLNNFPLLLLLEFKKI